MKIIDTQVLSERGTKIPLSIVEPDLFPAKLLICAHGFKAKRTEDGRFLTVAEALAKDGVLSIMMGFPGCDESKEDFLSYTLENCLSDIGSCVRYVKKRYELKNDTGMIGYSMGGRLTALYIQRHPEVTCIGLWAAATYDAFNGEDAFLGMGLAEMKAQIREKGYVDFYNTFDDSWIRLNGALIRESEELPVEKGLKEFTGAALVVHGDSDVTVPYEIALNSYADLEKAKDRKLVTVRGADHGFGQWNGRPDLSRELTDATIDYFRKHFV